jgi:N-acetylglucosamine-6-sulfatase
MVTKSCTQSTCRDPWSVIQPPSLLHGQKVETLDDALHPHYDAFYEAFPLVMIEECMNYQFAANEVPFYPPNAQFELGMEYRNSTDHYAYTTADPIETIAENAPLGGGWEQRHATYDTLMKAAKVLTDNEINNSS